MTQYNAGSAFIQIIPSFRGIEKMMQREVGKLSREIDKAIAQGTNDGILKAFRNVDTSQFGEVGRAGRKVGDKFAASVEEGIKQRIKDVSRALPEIEPRANLDKLDRAILRTGRELEKLSERPVDFADDASVQALLGDLDKLTAYLDKAGKSARRADQQFKLTTSLGAISDLRGDLAESQRRGRVAGGAYAAGAQKAIEQALKALPDVQLTTDASPAERAVAALREQLVALSEKKIGVDIDRDRFQQELEYVRAQLDSLARDPKSVALKYDLTEASKGLRKFGDSVAPTLEPALAEAGEQGGEVYAGAYAEKVRRRLAEAIQQIPNVPMTVDNSDAQRKLAAIRVSMEELSSKRIGVDIDAAAADARVEALLARLRALDNADVDIDVRTNAAAAAAQLELVRANTDQAGMSMLEFGRNATITMSRMGYLVAIGASVGSIIAPAAATAAVAVAGIGVAAAGAVAGIGVLALGLVGIADAVQKMDAYQQDMDKSARSLSQANSRVASAQDQVANAERNLANTRESNAEAEKSARERVTDAERDVTKARREAARAMRDATRADVEAQHDLTRAQAEQKTARRELNEALRDGVRALRELDTEAKKTSNQIDQATTASMKAKLELDKILANPRASEIERREARETYEEKLLQIESLKQKQEGLQEAQAKAARDGVESLDDVVKARKKVSDADERVRDAAVRAKSASERADEARVDGAERVAAAQRAVQSAERAATSQQRQSQQALASGQASLVSAQRALRQAYEGTGTAGGDALDNMRDAMDELSPAGRRFALFLYSLKPALKSLRDAAQEGLLPGLQAGIALLVTRYLPAFRDFVGDIALGMGRMFEATVRVLDAPQWQTFFGFIARTALPAMQGMWVAALNLARGVANLIVALYPLSAPMGAGLVDLTEKFALWSDSLKANPGFQRFLDYAATEGPAVVHLIGEMVTFIGRLLVAMAPIGAVIVDIATAVFEWMNSWDVGTLTRVVAVAAVLGTTVWALTGFVRTIRFVTEAWTAVSLIAAKAQTVVAAAVARYNAVTVSATASTGLLNGAMFRTAGAGAAGAAGLSAMSAAAGPLALAVAGVAAVWWVQTRAQRAAKETTDELGPALQELGQAYERAGNSATLGSQAVTDSFKRVVSQNGDMQQAVLTLTGLGASLDDIAGAASGSARELDKVMDLIEQRIAQLQQEQQDNFFSIFDNEERSKEMERLWALQERFKENADAAHLANQAMGVLATTTGRTATAAQLLTPVQQKLADAHAALADESSTAEDKINALKAAQDAINQSAIDGIEAEEAWNSTLLTLKGTVDSNKDANDKYATSLAMTNETGLRNRDMLQDLITNTNRMYDADVALNGVTEQTIQKAKDHITQIRETARQLGLNKTQTDRLIAAYSKIPEDVETAIGFKEGDFDKMFEQLEMAAFIQEGLRKNIPLGTVKHNYRTMISDRNRAAHLGWAGGGPIAGPGIVGGKTEDANLILASKGEYMQQAAAVDYYGTEFMDALNHRMIPRDVLPGYAKGGSILGGRQKWPFLVDVSKTFVPTQQQLQDQVWGDFAGGGAGLGGDGSVGGWQAMARVIKAAVKGMTVSSDYRPGDPGYHGRRRAIDMEFSDGSQDRGGGQALQAFNFIASNYGKGTKELIWDYSPWGLSTGIWNGERHRFRSASSGPGSHNDHIHWAYDQGGWLPPGHSTVFNGTGKPEPVLTAPQWDAVINGGMSDNSSGDTYNIEFAENKLTLADLEAHQQRRATLARQGRPR